MLSSYLVAYIMLAMSLGPLLTPSRPSRRANPYRTAGYAIQEKLFIIQGEQARLTVCGNPIPEI